jgi:glycyl-tRNA synthetase
MPAPTLDTISALARRRGLIFPSSDIYGGLSAAYDYGHYGLLLKRAIETRWIEAMTLARRDIVLLDSAIIQHPKTWVASGHAAGFADPMVECSDCQERFRADQLTTSVCPKQPSKTAGAGRSCAVSNEQAFQLMFEIQYGAQAGSAAQAWLRPETAQGIFTAFAHITRSHRLRLPFGIAQVGKSFRNEITTRQFIFRMREFTQMEMEWFTRPEDADEWFDFWRDERLAWWRGLGISAERLRLRDHDPDELAHYARATSDIEYAFPTGWQEVEGVANRSDHDLQAHAKYSGKSLTIRDPISGQAIIPHVIEPAAGLDRAVLAVLSEAYDEDERGGSPRVVLRLAPAIAPITAAVLPLVNKDGLPEIAEKVHQQLLEARIRSEYDTSGAIGRRYRRQDEIGTPWCLTIDHLSHDDDALTVRNRDTLDQVRLPIAGIGRWIEEHLRH